MKIIRLSVAWCVLVLTAVAVPLPAAELTTLEGRKATGQIVAITPTELKFKIGEAEENFLLTTINAVDTGNAAKPVSPGTKFAVVELVDGSTFRCDSFTLKGRQFSLKLLGVDGKPGRELSLPVTSVFSLFRDAQDLKLEQDFRSIVRNRGKFDIWITKTKGNTDGKEIDRLDIFPGTFGDADAAGEKIDFTLESTQRKVELQMSRVHGMIFNQIPKAAAPAICKVVDVEGNVMVAQSINRTAAGYQVKTVSDVTFDLVESTISKFDFAAGSVKYVSDLEPSSAVTTGTDAEPYQRDRTLDKQPIRLRFGDVKAERQDVREFRKGLTMHAKTVLSYDLKGQYKVFKAIAAVDFAVETPSRVTLTIDAGGQVLYKGSIKRDDKPIELNLNIQNADKLRITVESDGTLLDLGNQLSLAEAKVLK